MYRIIDRRGYGKTGRLMLLAKETNSAIVCANPTAMREKAYRYGIVGIDFISYEEAMNLSSTQNLMIDEIENFVCYCLKNKNVIGYTLSNED